MSTIRTKDKEQKVLYEVLQRRKAQKDNNPMTKEGQKIKFQVYRSFKRSRVLPQRNRTKFHLLLLQSSNPLSKSSKRNEWP